MHTAQDLYDLATSGVQKYTKILQEGTSTDPHLNQTIACLKMVQAYANWSVSAEEDQTQEIQSLYPAVEVIVAGEASPDMVDIQRLWGNVTASSNGTLPGDL